MPILFLIIGVMLIVVAVNDKMPELTGLVKEDFNPTGSVAGFPVWMAAIFVTGALGYIKAFRPVANAFLVLIVVSMVLSNRGFFSKFKSAIEGQ
jgi:hypothetical protein